MRGVVFQNANRRSVRIVARRQCVHVAALPGAEGAAMKTAYRKTQQEVWNKDGGKQGIGKVFVSHRKGMLISVDI